MKKTTLLFLAILSVLFSCSTKKLGNTSTSISSRSVLPANDGSSYEKAVVIQEKSEMTGVDAEYAWLRKYYPGYKFNGQSLNSHEKKSYDIISIVTADGEKKDVYFDISNFFGKF